MITGSVDPKTGNVPLRLDGGYLVHYEGQRGDGTLLVRLARSTTGPLMGFTGASELHQVIASLPAHLRTVSVQDVAEWVDARTAEPATS